ncbi:MAG: hypothetical protein ACPKPY_00450 [Nitrososphaeraceae archaeon]
MKNNNLSLIMLFSILSVFVVVVSLDSVYAQEENMTDVEEPKFFAIQHAQSGSITEINATAYSLELNDVFDKTILFSDRPDRIFTSDSTTNFIGNWTVGQDSFSIDAPNAVLGVDEQEGLQDTAIVKLFNPIYNVNKKTLKYEIAAENATSIDLPSEFGQTTLVIDNGGCGTKGCIPN